MHAGQGARCIKGRAQMQGRAEMQESQVHAGQGRDAGQSQVRAGQGAGCRAGCRCSTESGACRAEYMTQGRVQGA